MQEFTNGTDPRSATGILTLEPGLGAQNQPVLRFIAAAGRSYAIQSSATLAGWTTESVIHAAPQDGAVEHSLATTDARKFWRVVTPAP